MYGEAGWENVISYLLIFGMSPLPDIRYEFLCFTLVYNNKYSHTFENKQYFINFVTV